MQLFDPCQQFQLEQCFFTITAELSFGMSSGTLIKSLSLTSKSENACRKFLSIKRLHIADFAALFIVGVLSGILSGGLMNVVNGWVSPSYFGLLFYYPGGSPSWSQQELYWHSVEHGLLEGLVFGCVIAAVFTLFVFFVSRAGCRFAFAVTFLPKIVGTAFLFWLLGGLNGIFAGLLFPNFSSYLIDLGGVQSDRLKFLWVGGSIYGVYFGSIIALICGCVWFNRRWKKTKHSVSPDSPTSSKATLN